MKINIINTTTDSTLTAQNIAKYLLKNALSPCIQIIQNINSIYKWKGKINNSNEYLLIIKTLPKHLDECKKCILEHHNYDIPEIIVTESEILTDMYRDWFNKNSIQ